MQNYMHPAGRRRCKNSCENLPQVRYPLRRRKQTGDNRRTTCQHIHPGFTIDWISRKIKQLGLRAPKDGQGNDAVAISGWERTTARQHRQKSIQSNISVQWPNETGSFVLVTLAKQCNTHRHSHGAAISKKQYPWSATDGPRCVRSFFGAFAVQAQGTSRLLGSCHFLGALGHGWVVLRLRWRRLEWQVVVLDFFTSPPNKSKHCQKGMEK